MYLPIRTLRTSGIPRCRIASRTAFPCGSSTAVFGMTTTFTFIGSPYLQLIARTSAIENCTEMFARSRWRRVTADNEFLFVNTLQFDPNAAAPSGLIRRTALFSNNPLQAPALHLLKQGGSVSADLARETNRIAGV